MGGGGGLGKIGYVGYWSWTVAINVLLSFNFDYVFYSMHFRFHQVSKKALPLFELFSFAAIRREIEMMRKMEMAREIAIWREMVRGKDGDS